MKSGFPETFRTYNQKKKERSDHTEKNVSSDADKCQFGGFHDHGLRDSGAQAKFPSRPMTMICPYGAEGEWMARLKYIVKTTLIHMKETEQVITDKSPQELRIQFPLIHVKELLASMNINRKRANRRIDHFH
jgi:hypothetical protein